MKISRGNLSGDIRPVDPVFIRLKEWAVDLSGRGKTDQIPTVKAVLTWKIDYLAVKELSQAMEEQVRDKIGKRGS